MGGRWASRRPLTWLLAFVLSTLLIHDVSSAGAAGGYYGKFLGKLNTLHHSVSGDVYAVDSRTLHIRDFNYDGEAPDAFFYAGTTKNPSGSGFRIRDEKGTLNVLGKYKKKHVTLTLPEGKSLANIRWFSVWCREFEVNFADVRIPPGFDFPKPLKIAAIDAGIHGVKSDPITVVDAQTLLVPNFSYDGEAPDAKFWAGRGERPDSQGIRVADENGRIGTPLRRYDRRTLVLTLPGDLTVFDIGHFGVWCEAFAVDFGHVSIPRNPNVPPSLRMLGVSPQKKRPRENEDVQIDRSQSYQFPSQDQSSQPFVYSPLRRNFQGLQLTSATDVQPSTYRPDVQQWNHYQQQPQQQPSYSLQFPQQRFLFQRRQDHFFPQQQQYFIAPQFGQYQH